MMHCSSCGRDFGGQFAYDRHIARREGWRCRSDAELEDRGLGLRADGAWGQTRSFYRQLRLFRLPPGRPRKGPWILWGRRVRAVRPWARRSGRPRPQQPQIPPLRWTRWEAA